jgi:hypothetical protein
VLTFEAEAIERRIKGPQLHVIEGDKA